MPAATCPLTTVDIDDRTALPAFFFPSQKNIQHGWGGEKRRAGMELGDTDFEGPHFGLSQQPTLHQNRTLRERGITEEISPYWNDSYSRNDRSIDHDAYNIKVFEAIPETKDITLKSPGGRAYDLLLRK
jgi:hypothetical protein